MSLSPELMFRANEFAQKNNLDQRCVDDLLSQPTWIVERILDTITINPMCQNPSAVVTTKIGAIKREEKELNGNGLNLNANGNGNLNGDNYNNPFSPNNHSLSNDNDSNATIPPPATLGNQGAITPPPATQTVHAAVVATTVTVSQITASNYNDENYYSLDIYSQENRLDGRAIELLKNTTPEVRRCVILQGPLAGNIRSTGAVIQSRIAKAMKDLGGVNSNTLHQNNFNHNGNTVSNYHNHMNNTGHATKTIYHNGGNGQSGHGGHGGTIRSYQMNHHNNNSAILNQNDPRFKPPPTSDIHAFVDRALADDRARIALLEAPPGVQAGVLRDGPIVDSDNPSAVLMSRIGKHRKLVAAAGGVGYSNQNNNGNGYNNHNGYNNNYNNYNNGYNNHQHGYHNGTQTQRAHSNNSYQSNNIGMPIGYPGQMIGMNNFDNMGPGMQGPNPNMPNMANNMNNFHNNQDFRDRSRSPHRPGGPGQNQMNYMGTRFRSNIPSLNPPFYNMPGSEYHGSREECQDPEMREQIFEFCRLNQLSNEVQHRLLRSDDGAIESIMSLGEFPLGCQDPSQIIMERLDNLPSYAPAFHAFLRDNGVDDDAQGVFLTQSVGVMERVVNGGPLEGRNVSALLMSRIKAAKAAGL